ncbi:type I restriction-modification system subunit M [Paraburkholderia sp. BR10954]|uniref:type I restriction-modification system subunit M n=1 Tax=Paraburkholderia sp. BR10954 TaxID=3236995 RepID=UPI0034D1BDE7
MSDQKTINDVVWRACDTFRGTIDPSQYKDYILVMLFVKYLSDMRREKLHEYTQRYSGDAERIERAMGRERFVLPEECDFEHLHAMRSEANIGERINIALQKIEDTNKSKLEGVFRNIDFNSEANLGETKERNARLKHLLEDFADDRLDLRPSKVGARDVIGDVYEYLIGNFASDSGKKGGEFYTPAEVSRLLAAIVAPKAGDRICDPCCGSGSLLIRAAREVGSDNFSAYGQELNGTTWALCRMNMFLHGLDTARIERGDTIRNPKLAEDDALMHFNVVVANPPFSLDKWGEDTATSDRYKRFWRGTPPKSRGDYAFVSHMVETMTETDGRVGVVLPHGVLFRGGSEGLIRRRFVEENLLDGVIGLPANLFFGVGIPAALMFFRRNKADKNVFFIDASREFAEGKNQNRLRQEDIDRIVATWRARKEVPKYAHLATTEEIAGNDYNLNIPLYVDTYEEEAPVDLVAVKAEISRIESELATTRAQLAAALRELNL